MRLHEFLQRTTNTEVVGSLQVFMQTHDSIEFACNMQVGTLASPTLLTCHCSVCPVDMSQPCFCSVSSSPKVLPCLMHGMAIRGTQACIVMSLPVM